MIWIVSNAFESSEASNFSNFVTERPYPFASRVAVASISLTKAAPSSAILLLSSSLVKKGHIFGNKRTNCLALVLLRKGRHTVTTPTTFEFVELSTNPVQFADFQLTDVSTGELFKFTPKTDIYITLEFRGGREV